MKNVAEVRLSEEVVKHFATATPSNWRMLYSLVWDRVGGPFANTSSSAEQKNEYSLDLNTKKHLIQSIQH